MPKQETTMSEMFKGYSDYSDNEYKRIWSNSLIVVDANILLNFYRYSEDTRKTFFNILDKLKGRLWIPYQVGKEFFDNKNSVMITSYNEYENMIKSIRKTFEEAKNVVDKRKNNQLKCKGDIYNVLEDNLKKIENLLTNEKNEKTPKFEKNEIEKHIIKIFDKCIGDDFDDKEYEEIKKEGLRRFEKKIPPGYKDNEKEENGDYYIFYSLIKKSKTDNKDIIFITDDVKEDWFNEYNGEKHGGRYELLNEFYKETGNLLLIYTSDGFVKSYNKNIEKSELDEKIINELINIRNKEYIKENNNIINYNSFKMFKHFDHDMIHLLNGLNKDEIYHYLLSMIRKIDIPEYQRHKLYRRFLGIKRSDNLDLNIHDIVELMELIEEYRNKYSNEKYEMHLLEDIKNNYMHLLSELKNSKIKAEEIYVYSKIYDYTKECLKMMDKIPSKYSYILSDKLDKLLIIISNNKNKTLNKVEIIDQLEQILNLEYEIL